MRSKVVDRMLSDTPEWIKDEIDSYAKLIVYDVSDSMPLCNHDFEIKDIYWSSCKKCGMIVPTLTF
jgi:hypothetical protein